MSGIFQAAYQCVYYLFDTVRSSWPVKLIYSSRLKPVPPSTVRQVIQIQSCLYEWKDSTDPQSIHTVIKKVEELPFHEDILSVKDADSNLDLLHHAIITNNEAVVNLLLQQTTFAQLLSCNSYMHVAALLGHFHVLQSLIEKCPKDVYKAAGLCYPKLHIHVTQRHIYGVMYDRKFHCQLEKHLPVEYAIERDHITCVTFLLSKMSESCYHKAPTPSHLLHFALDRGAVSCATYFVSMFPGEVNTRNAEGDAPLLKAVIWGKDISKVLIDNGADVKCVAQNGDTALHRLYRNDVDGIFAIFETTKYLLTTGIEQLVNSINLKGETALHLVVTHISFVGGKKYHERQISRWELQKDYQEQVIQTIRLLLKFNADPHIFDSNDLQPLNKLLHVTVKACNPADPCECVQASIPSKYVYHNDFGYLARAMQILIDNGADVNTQCAIGHTPLILLIQCFLHMEFLDMEGQSDNIIKCIECLLASGANCDFTSEDKSTCSTLLAQIAAGFLRSGTRMDVKMKQEMADLMNKILRTFLRYGLDPNHMTNKKSRHLQGGNGNAMIEFVRLIVYARSAGDFKMIRSWLVTLLQWGGNPDIEPYPSDPIICHSQSSIYLKKQGTQAISHCMDALKDQDDIFESGVALGLLMLFYNTMDHSTFFSCISTACSVARFHPPAGGTKLLSLLHSLTDQPRSLKQMARVSIYKSVNRKIARSVDQLPLPKAMKVYLMEIE